MEVVAIIQSRMGSKRLPGKVLMLIEKKPMLWHVVERIKQAKKIDKIVIATTDNKEDDVIEELASKERWLIYRGSSEDVLDRYYQTAKYFKADIIFRGSGDLPLIDPFIIDKCIEKLIDNDYDFISNCQDDLSTFPRGLDVRVFSFRALEIAHQKAKEQYEIEHVTPYIFENKNNEFKIGPTIEAEHKYRADYRLTVDYKEDFELIKKIYQIFYKPGEIINVPEVISFLNKNPEIAKINADCEQKPFKQKFYNVIL